jgi:cytochrome bd-type quinol oxidase subunit 2
MRAIAGSIIAAGALIGLGFAALGVGTRYQNLAANDPASITYLKWAQLDTPMMLIIVVLLASLFVGLATAFLGLAYEHEGLCHDRDRTLAERAASAVR